MKKRTGQQRSTCPQSCRPVSRLQRSSTCCPEDETFSENPLELVIDSMIVNCSLTADNFNLGEAVLHASVSPFIEHHVQFRVSHLLGTSKHSDGRNGRRRDRVRDGESCDS